MKNSTMKAFCGSPGLMTLGLALSLATALVACGDDETTPPTTTASTTTTGGGGGGGTGGSGGGEPSTPCTIYCAAVTTACTGDLAEYADEADCVDYCEASGWEVGDASDQAGNTISCRTYHATVAQDAPDVHCPHAGPSGGEVCGTISFATEPSTDFTRVDRMGMPAVSTALVSGPNKNGYNDGNPETDTAAANGPEVIANLTAIHTALDDDLTGAGLTPCSMVPPLVNGLPECIGQEVAPGVTVASLVLPDTLTIDTSAPAGFPNGRLLADPVIDITLAVILLKLDSATGCGGGPCTPGTLVGLSGGMGLNPVKNDVADGVFLDTFPYLHPPHAP